MIPTTYKCKLPKELSYPVGAKAVSESLEGIGLYPNLKLCFSDNPFIRHSEFLSKLKNQGTLRVLQLCYSYMRPTSGFMINMGWVGEKWLISIYPVPSDHKYRVQQYLIRTGLPKLKEWLSIKRPETWYDGRHCFSIAYNLSSQEFVMKTE